MKVGLQGSGPVVLKAPLPHEKAAMELAMRRCLEAIIKDAAQFREPVMEFRGRAEGSLGMTAAAPHPLVPRLLALAIILAKGKHIDHSEFRPFYCSSAACKVHIGIVLAKSLQKA